MKRKLTAWGLTLLLSLGVIVPVYGDELSNKQQELQNVRQQMDEQQRNLNSARQREKTIMGQVNSLEQQMNKTQGEINLLTEKVNFLQKKIKDAEKEIAQLEKELEKQTEILSNRLVFIYQQGDISYLEVLLAAEDFRDFLTRYDLLSKIISQDQELIESVQKQKRELDAKKSDLEVQKKELVAAQQQQQENNKILASQLGDKKEILGNVQVEKDKYAQALKELEQASREMESIIRRLQSGSQGAQIGTGSYCWPTPGYTNITSAYGMRYHPILKVRKLHTGIDIGASSGASIVAVDSGKVIYSGWMGAYGQVVVIDHGGGVSTLYAHQSTRLAGEGKSVNKGDVIGKVGSTGWSTGPHLHFEVRVNGSPVDPRAYI